MFVGPPPKKKKMAAKLSLLPRYMIPPIFSSAVKTTRHARRFLLLIPLVFVAAYGPFAYYFGYHGDWGWGNIIGGGGGTGLLATTKNQVVVAPESDIVDWWEDLFLHMDASRPRAGPVRLKKSIHAAYEKWLPGQPINHTRPHLVKLSAGDKKGLQRGHATFIDGLPRLTNSLPYDPETTGIVTTIDPHRIGLVVTMLLMLRRTGSTLPVQIILHKTNTAVSNLCLGPQFARLGATCLVLQHTWSSLHKTPPRFEKFQWKILAMLASPFQTLLFLDADNLPVRNPDDLFRQGQQPLAATGLVTWPDFWTPSQSPDFYEIVSRGGGGQSQGQEGKMKGKGERFPVPPLTERTSSESGVMVVDKARHGDTLLLAAYYNVYGPSWYYPLLSQHGAGEGDKETYLAAAMVLDWLFKTGEYRPIHDRTGVAYWDVKHMPVSYGRIIKGKKWKGTFLTQMDAVEDFRAVMEAAGIDVDSSSPSSFSSFPFPERNSTETTTTTTTVTTETTTTKTTGVETETETETETGTGMGSEVRVDVNAGKVKVKAKRKFFEEIDDLPEFLTTTTNLTIHYREDRCMFFHHSGVKLDFARIASWGSEIVAKGRDGKILRLWPDQREWIDRWAGGRDVERDMWEDAMNFWCELGGTSGGYSYGRACRRMREVWEAVYAGS